MLPVRTTLGTTVPALAVSPLQPNQIPPVSRNAASTPTVRPPAVAALLPEIGVTRFETTTSRLTSYGAVVADDVPPGSRSASSRSRWHRSANGCEENRPASQNRDRCPRTLGEGGCGQQASLRASRAPPSAGLTDRPMDLPERTRDKSVLRLDEIIGFYSKVAQAHSAGGASNPCSHCCIALTSGWR